MSDADVSPSSPLDPVSTDGPGVGHKDNVALKSSPSPHRPDENQPGSKDNATADREEDNTKADSEAETIIQSGRESLSPRR